jgi:hypothetical protein
LASRQANCDFLIIWFSATRTWLPFLGFMASKNWWRSCWRWGNHWSIG